MGTLAALAGCRLFPGGHSDCSIRLIDAVPDATALRVAVDSKKVFQGCRFRDNTGYQGIPAGSYQVYAAAERGAESEIHLPIENVNAQLHHRYTALALGVAG